MTIRRNPSLINWALAKRRIADGSAVNTFYFGLCPKTRLNLSLVSDGLDKQFRSGFGHTGDSKQPLKSRLSSLIKVNS
jgi:hypothetical protein